LIAGIIVSRSQAPAFILYGDEIMNYRLLYIADHIDAGIGLVDVGTDHAYLPMHMAQHGYKGNIIASDINDGPLQKARRNIDAADLSDRIQLILCNGLELCPPELVDTIVIAGMGGDLICAILDAAEWCMDSKYKLILQPMSKAEVLRYWLVNNGFEILCEDTVPDDKTIYQIIVSRFGGCTKLNDAQLFIGKRELACDNALYEQLRTSLFKRFNSAIESMEANPDISVPYRMELYKEIVSQLKDV